MASPATERTRWLALAAKLAVTVALLVVVARLADPIAAARELAGAGAGGLTLAFVLNGLSVAVSAARWQRVLARLGERVALRDLVADVLVGTTYNLLLPTSIGGDVARSLRCARRVGVPEHAWASVAFERLIGLLALVAVSGAGLATIARGRAGWLGGVAAVVVVVVVGALLGLPVALRGAAHVRRFGWERAASAFERVGAALAGPLASPAARLEALAWSVGYHVTALALLVPLGWAWGEPRLLEAVFLGVPLALVATVLPISVGGLGVRESLMVVVLAPFGLSAPRALALGAAWLASMIVVALAGAGVLLLERSGPSRSPPGHAIEGDGDGAGVR
ncbi:MAG: flippase-like domain-containing protein [Polyangiaceae bacterium]|nr:flippase-like domain-containing protein [Polyangiaceae bacterium]